MPRPLVTDGHLVGFIPAAVADAWPAKRRLLAVARRVRDSSPRRGICRQSDHPRSLHTGGSLDGTRRRHHHLGTSLLPPARPPRRFHRGRRPPSCLLLRLRRHRRRRPPSRRVPTTATCPDASSSSISATPSTAPSSTSANYNADRVRFYLMNPDGSDLKELLPGQPAGGKNMADVSPDGTAVVFQDGGDTTKSMKSGSTHPVPHRHHGL